MTSPALGCWDTSRSQRPSDSLGLLQQNARGWVASTRGICLSQFWRLESARLRGQHTRGQARALFPACRWPCCCSVLMGQRESSSSSFSEGTKPILGPHSRPHLTLITFLRCHLQCHRHTGIELQHVNLGRHSVRSLTVPITYCVTLVLSHVSKSPQYHSF